MEKLTTCEEERNSRKVEVTSPFHPDSHLVTSHMLFVLSRLSLALFHLSLSLLIGATR